MFIVACQKTIDTVDEENHMLNQKTITINDHLVSSNEPNFTINHDVPIEKNTFDFEPYFSNSMVLQANAVIKFEGAYDTDGPIALTLQGKTFYTEVINQSFSFFIGPFAYDESLELIIYTQTSRYVFTDVSVGEVFLLSGQSNMAITLSQILRNANDIYTQKINQSIRDINHQKIRFITVGMLGYSEPLDAFQPHQTYGWDKLTQDNASSVSATAFYFAEEMVKQLDVPIGLVISAVGATNTNTWIPPQEAVGMDTTYIKNISDADTPSRYYNGMVHPLRELTFRGVIWYQGEGQHVKYEDNMKRLIQGWRREFIYSDLKFLIIELPRFDVDLGYTQESWFQVRKQQQSLANLEGVTYAVSIDLGIVSRETDDPIHPYDKDMIGLRAAHAFIGKFYELPGIWTSPRLIYAGYMEGKLIMKFTNVGDGIYLSEFKAGFEVSVDGTRFNHAEPIIIDHETIELRTTLQGVKAIRYAYQYVIPEVFGGDGTPSSLRDLVSVYNSGHYPLDQFLIYLREET